MSDDEREEENWKKIKMWHEAQELEKEIRRTISGKRDMESMVPRVGGKYDRYPLTDPRSAIYKPSLAKYRMILKDLRQIEKYGKLNKYQQQLQKSSMNNREMQAKETRGHAAMKHEACYTDYTKM